MQKQTQQLEEGKKGGEIFASSRDHLSPVTRPKKGGKDSPRERQWGMMARGWKAGLGGLAKNKPKYDGSPPKRKGEGGDIGRKTVTQWHDQHT